MISHQISYIAVHNTAARLFKNQKTTALILAHFSNDTLNLRNNGIPSNISATPQKLPRTHARNITSLTLPDFRASPHPRTHSSLLQTYLTSLRHAGNISKLRQQLAFSSSSTPPFAATRSVLVTNRSPFTKALTRKMIRLRQSSTLSTTAVVSHPSCK